jgi:predicted outer membrane repeat protein
MSTSRIPVILRRLLRFMGFMAILGGLIVAPSFPGKAAAGWPRYISPGGNDNANDCRNSGSPCKTIAHALSVASDDDHLYLDAGVYQEHDLLIDQNQLIVQKDPGKTCPINLGYVFIPCPTIDGGGAARVLHVTGQNVTLEDLAIQGGKLIDTAGAGILNEGTLTLERVEISNNTADILSSNDANKYLSTGGGINNQGQLAILDSSIFANSAYTGGGIYSTGKLTIRGTRIYSNTAIGNGGGLDNAVCAEMTVESSSFWENQAQDGGGIFIYDNSHPEVCSAIILRNVTITENSAVHVYGGVYGVGGLRSSSRVQIDHATFFNNHAAGSPVDSLLLEENQLTLNPQGLPSTIASTIIAHTSGSANLCGFLHSALMLGPGGRNLSSDNSCHFSFPEDFQNTDPLLLPLVDNGGPVETCALRSNSPAIDHGGAYPGGTDARGLAPRDGNFDGIVAPDIGAYEYIPMTIYLPFVRR